MKPQKLPFKQFLDSFKFVPRIGVNLFITNKNNKILLTKRAKDPFKDHWHFPGGFLLKGEKLEDCVKRIAKDELNLSLNTSKLELAGVFENLDSDPRGHILDIFYKFRIANAAFPESFADSKEIKFFDKVPQDIGFNHLEYLKHFGYS
ncbi:NUDIX hydrolase [Candidatus Daviesbacteria bacterium]|nr:NUDIX hydrolase [Candidatus Daviesbacteria bacterium]